MSDSKMKANGYVAIGTNDKAIWGDGASPEEAIARAEEAEGRGETRFYTLPASKAVLFQSRNSRMAVLEWSQIDGVACTTSEADEADDPLDDFNYVGSRHHY